MPAVSKKPLLTPQDTLIDSPRKSCKGQSILKANQLFLGDIHQRTGGSNRHIGRGQKYGAFSASDEASSEITH